MNMDTGGGKDVCLHVMYICMLLFTQETACHITFTPLHLDIRVSFLWADVKHGRGVTCITRPSTSSCFHSKARIGYLECKVRIGSWYTWKCAVGAPEELYSHIFLLHVSITTQRLSFLQAAEESDSVTCRVEKDERIHGYHIFPSARP